MSKPQKAAATRLTPEELETVANLDQFKMFHATIKELARDFSRQDFADCEEVTHPGEKQTIYLILKGQVIVISEERIYKKVGQVVRKARKIRAKAAQAAQEAGEEVPAAAEGEQDGEDGETALKFQTDFPYEEVGKGEYKALSGEGVTFGNDKTLTGRNFRPSFALAAAPETVIVSIPVRVIEDAIKKLANTGENKKKTDFFKKFQWFDNFTQSLKTKFNNCATEKTFYPGMQLITEGKNDLMAYVIISGTVNLVCKKSGQKFTVLEYQEDPTKAKRDNERNNDRNRNSNKVTSSLGSLVKNGYISQTLRTIQIGMKSTHEWIGEDLFIMESPHQNTFEYTAIAEAKVVVYAIHYSDLFKIPQRARDQMANIARTRKQVIIQRTLDLYNNLKAIKKKLDVGEQYTDDKQMRAETHKHSLKLGNQLRSLVDKESIFKPPPDPKLVRREKISKQGLRQAHSVVKQIQGVQFSTFDDGSTVEEEVFLPQISPNPKDRRIQDILNGSPDGHSKSAKVMRPYRTNQQTISMSTKDIQNYQFANTASTLSAERLYAAQANNRSFNGTVEQSAGANSALDKRALSMVIDQGRYVTSRHGRPENASTSSKKGQNGNPYQQSQQQQILMRVINEMNQDALGASQGIQVSAENRRSVAQMLSRNGKQVQQLTYPSNLESVSQRSQSAVSRVGPNSIYSAMKNYNRNIMNEQKNKPFKSHDIAVEIINKPQQKFTKLENAQSLKPYINPNQANNRFGRQDSVSQAKSLKLIPIYQTKEYTKMKGLLPCIQEPGKQHSLIQLQIENQRSAEEFDQKKEEDFAAKQKRLIDQKNLAQKKSVSRVDINKLKKIEDQLLQVQEDYKNIVNPYMLQAKKQMKLRISDFSVSDQAKAQQLLDTQKLKIQMAQVMSKNHTEIEMFEGKVGTRAIKDYDNSAKMININVSVKKEIPDNSNPDQMNPIVQVKQINLNMNIRDEDLSQVKFDHTLAQQLLLQDQGQSPIQNFMTDPGFSRSAESTSSYQRARRIPMKDASPKRSERKQDGAESSGSRERIGTPNPWYHHQKRKLLLQYQKQLLEESFYEQEQVEERRRIQAAKTTGKKNRRVATTAEAEPESAEIKANENENEE